MKKQHKYLSIIVPLYNKERSVVKSLKHIQFVLDSLPYTYEIVIVVDGKKDKTFDIARKLNLPNVRIYGYPTNKGKGYALRYGMARSTGDIVGFIDGDEDLDPTGLHMLLLHFIWYKADIIVGSKWHPVSLVKYPLLRKIISRGYGLVVKLLFNLPIRDTQLGMKFYRREVLEDVLPRLLVKKFAFDIEVLAVARYLGYDRIFEAPVELNWTDVESSISKGIIKNIVETLWDTLAVFYRLKILKYYDNENKRKWKLDKELNLRINIVD